MGPGIRIQTHISSFPKHQHLIGHIWNSYQQQKNIKKKTGKFYLGEVWKKIANLQWLVASSIPNLKLHWEAGRQLPGPLPSHRSFSGFQVVRAGCVSQLRGPKKIGQKMMTIFGKAADFKRSSFFDILFWIIDVCLLEAKHSSYANHQKIWARRFRSYVVANSPLPFPLTWMLCCHTSQPQWLLA